MAIPKKTPETKEEILGYWILQTIEFHHRLMKNLAPTLGDFQEMNSLNGSLRKATEEAGIDLSVRPGTVYCGRRVGKDGNTYE